MQRRPEQVDHALALFGISWWVRKRSCVTAPTIPENQPGSAGRIEMSAKLVQFHRMCGGLGGLRIGLVFAAGLIVSACEVTETSGTYRPAPICTAQYDPVCAERRGYERTFPNACEARTEGWRIVADGQCRADNYGGYRRDRDYRDYGDYRRRDRNRYEYSNRRPRERDFTHRPSRPQRPVQPTAPAPVHPQPPSTQPGACPQVFDQVCGSLGGRDMRFANRCEMLRAGAIEVSGGSCGGNDR